MIYYSNFDVSDGGFPPIQPHRYWQVEFLSSEFDDNLIGTSDSTGMSELQVLESYAGGNLIHSATLSTNATATTSAGQTFSKITDGLWGHSGADQASQDHMWAPYCLASDYVHVQMDFGVGVEKTLNIVRIGGGGWANVNLTEYLPSRIRVRGSDDGSTWTTYWEKDAPAIWTMWAMQDFVRPGYTEPAYSGSPHPAYRYWRALYFSVETALYGYATVELELRTTAGGATVATGGTASAFKNSSGGNGSNAPFDNNDATLQYQTFTSGNRANLWVKYDRGAGNAVRVGQIALKGRPDGGSNNHHQTPKRIGIQGSNDNSLWTTIFTPDLGSPPTDGSFIVRTDPLYV